MKTDGTLKIFGMQVGYSEWSAQPGAKTVVLLHGWGASRTLFERAATALHQHGANRILTVDFPGFGESDTPDRVWQVDDFVSFLFEVLDQLKVSHVDMLVGHSHGGRVALKSAVVQPNRIRKLLLVGSAGIRLPLSIRKKIRVMAFKACKRALPLLFWNSERREDVLQWLRAQFGSADYRDAGNMRNTLIALLHEDLTPILSQIKQPTLLVWGAEDTDAPLRIAKIIEREIPDTGLVVWEKAGHYAFLDRPDQFDRVSAHFLG